ncbi:polysaccharide export protein [Acidobacteria bacterium AB60]|nr:polysaccharide export protein [Acidobacteria bacterium AB60]
MLRMRQFRCDRKMVGAATLLSLSLVGVVSSAADAHAQVKGSQQLEADVTAASAKSPADRHGYVLGPQDALTIRVLDEDDIGEKPYTVDLNGEIALPRVGAVHVAGLTAAEVQARLTERYHAYLKNPVVTVSITEYRSQPVTLLGAVANPGVHQIEGRKTLFQVISEAGGLKQEAGNTIQITRELQYGALPLASAHSDPSGKFSVGDISVRSILKAEDPGQNIAVMPYDVITVPKAEMVYVVGAVHKSGGFVLSERSEMSVLELLSLAEGMDRTAGGKNARILRASNDSDHRNEIPLDLNKIIQGKSPDVSLRSNDILFVPNSTGKSATLRALETILSTGSGVAIYHPY